MNHCENVRNCILLIKFCLEICLYYWSFRSKLKNYLLWCLRCETLHKNKNSVSNTLFLPRLLFSTTECFFILQVILAAIIMRFTDAFTIFFILLFVDHSFVCILWMKELLVDSDFLEITNVFFHVHIESCTKTISSLFYFQTSWRRPTIHKKRYV